jgi:hypothetical protein
MNFKIWKEALMAYFNVIFQYLPTETEEDLGQEKWSLEW